MILQGLSTLIGVKIGDGNIEAPRARASRGRVAASTFGRLCRPKVVKIPRDPKGNTCQRQVFPFGAADEARTRYLHLGKVALYQMSYSRRYDCADAQCLIGAADEARTRYHTPQKQAFAGPRTSIKKSSGSGSACCRMGKYSLGDGFGAADEARTRYLHLGKVALYQMSYSRIYYRAGAPARYLL